MVASLTPASVFSLGTAVTGTGRALINLYAANSVLSGTVESSAGGAADLVITSPTGLVSIRTPVGLNVRGTGTNDGLIDSNGGGGRLILQTIALGNVGVQVAAPTALIHVAAGSATTSKAPFKFTSGTNLTTAEAGAVEYNGTNLFFTRSGTVRENVLVAIDNVAAPSTSVGVAITNYYGSAATNFLGDPNRWLSVNVLGSTYKIPLYN